MTQIDKLLAELKKGPVNSFEATYFLGIKQAPTRINELRELGYDITSSPMKANRSVDWTLNSTERDDLYTWDFSGGSAKRILKSELNKPEQLSL